MIEFINDRIHERLLCVCCYWENYEASDVILRAPRHSLLFLAVNVKLNVRRDAYLCNAMN